MKAIFVFTLLLLALDVAGQDYLYTGAWTKHLSRSDVDYVENNNLIAYEHNKWLVGHFTTSYNHDGTLLLRDVYRKPLGDFELKVYAGAAYGYSLCIGDKKPADTVKTCPAIVPGIVYKRYKFQPGLLMFGNAAVLTFRWQL